MEGKYFSNLSTKDIDDAVVFNNTQNRYVYSLEHTFNFNNSDFQLILKVVDVDGNFENSFFNENFYQKLMSDTVNKYLNSKQNFSDFNNVIAEKLTAKLKIYVAYGIGDDLDTWTDPMCCTLVGADIDVANNGLRTYTYRFIPQINNFFRPLPEKENTRPLDLDFGHVTSYTEYSLDLYKNKEKDVEGNLEQLLRGFVSITCNVPQNNVIVVLPEINSELSNASGQAGEVLFTSVIGVSLIRPKIKSLIAEDFSKLKFMTAFYTGLFKDIYVEEIPKGIIQDVLGKKVVWNGVSKSDYFLEQHKKIQSDANLKREKFAQNATELQSSIDALKPKAPTYSPLSPEIKTKLSRELGDLNLKRLLLERALSNSLNSYSNDDITKRNDELIKIKSRIATIESNLKIEPPKPKFDVSKSLLKATKNLMDTNDYNIKNLNKSSKDQDKLLSQLDKLEPGKFRLTIRSESDTNNSKDPNKAIVPNWRQTIDKVFKGISTALNDKYIVPEITYETNLRWLKLFKSYGLIEDETKPCVVIGDRQLVLDYLYINNYTLANKNLTAMPSKRTTIRLQSKLLNILSSQSYFDSVRDLVFRKRSGSSFSEELFKDELSIVLNETERQVLDTISFRANFFDIPIFINNYRNSNVLSYSYKNSENYFAAIQNSVKDNRAKALYENLDEAQRIKLLERAGLTYGLTSLSNPKELAQIIFAEAVNGLVPYNLDKRQKISSEISTEVSKYQGLGAGRYDLRGRNSQGTGPRDIEDKNYLKFAKEKLSDDQQKFFKSLLESREYLNGVVIPTNDDGLSYLNLLVQTKLIDFGFKVAKEEIYALAQFIILLNIGIDQSNINSITFAPGLTMPGQNFILAKIHEYSKRYAAEITVKTLPFFNLTDTRTINKPAIFFSKRVSFNNFKEDINLDFFSGEYRIVGFRHLITTTECYSEFLLTKFGANNEGLSGGIELDKGNNE
jgi:hypothetical protein